MKRSFLIPIIIAVILACQVIPTPPARNATPLVSRTASPGGLSPTATGFTTASPAIRSATTTARGTEVSPGLAPGILPEFPYNPSEPFSPVGIVPWVPGPTAGVGVELPVDLAEVTNLEVADGLTNQQRATLARNGYVIVTSQEPAFNEIREHVSLRYGQPYFLTTDAAYHAMDGALDGMLVALEKEELLPRMVALTRATMDEVESYMPLVSGTEVEADTRLAEAYLGVALRLFDPEAALDPESEEVVRSQVEQVLAGRGPGDSLLIPGFSDDYSAYAPVGHYKGDPLLEAYFRGMTWLRRVRFNLDVQTSGLPPSRLPLIITLALRRANMGGEPAAIEWVRIYEALTFLLGPSDEWNPALYADLMDQVYGASATIVALTDDELWAYFQLLSTQLPPPKIDSAFVQSLGGLMSGGGWSFVGSRFNLDAYILENLIYDKVGRQDNPRELPSGLDVMAVLGSPVALDVLQVSGETDYAGYMQQMERLRLATAEQRETQWLNNASSTWLYSFIPGLTEKSAAYPPFMRTVSWGYKDLNTALASWVELNHESKLSGLAPKIDTTEAEPPMSGPAPGYVEPNPDIFYLLSYIANTTVEGLKQRGMVGGDNPEPASLSALLREIQDLGDRLQQLGDIAADELSGQTLDENDFALIQDPLGPQDSRLSLASEGDGGSTKETSPIEVITVVAEAGERFLHAATGPLNRIFVIVPLNGELQIAQGGVFSYYEFLWRPEERLGDEAWRLLLVLEPPEAPSWMNNFILPGGSPIDVLAFRVGDVYRITLDGSGLNLHYDPFLNSGVVRRLVVGEYAMIVEGPLQAEGYTWWKLRLDLQEDDPIEGWAVGDPFWYERAWGQ